MGKIKINKKTTCSKGWGGGFRSQKHGLVLALLALPCICTANTSVGCPMRTPRRLPLELVQEAPPLCPVPHTHTHTNSVQLFVNRNDFMLKLLRRKFFFFFFFFLVCALAGLFGSQEVRGRVMQRPHSLCIGLRLCMHSCPSTASKFSIHLGSSCQSRTTCCCFSAIRPSTKVRSRLKKTQREESSHSPMMRHHDLLLLC